MIVIEKDTIYTCSKLFVFNLYYNYLNSLFHFSCKIKLMFTYVYYYITYCKQLLSYNLT